MATVHLENFISVRKRYPEYKLEVAAARVAQPVTERELDYRNLLSEANRSYFYREYGLAIEGYLNLRQTILIQSHPEMPMVSGLGNLVAIDTTKIDPSRLFELGRRHLEAAEPGTPVRIKAAGERMIHTGEFAVNTVFAPITNLGLDSNIVGKAELSSVRIKARNLILDGDLAGAASIYNRASDQAASRKDHRAAAELLVESGAMAATYTKGAARKQALTSAAASFRDAITIFKAAGDSRGESIAQTNLNNANAELTAGSPSSPTPARSRINLPDPQTTKVYVCAEDGHWQPASTFVASAKVLRPVERHAAFFNATGAKTVSLASANYESNLKTQIYSPRISASNLEGLEFYEGNGTNFAAYIPHLFFYTLPVALGDAYMAQGSYDKALEEYRAAQKYTFSNLTLETADLWQRMAKLYLKWGGDLFRKNRPADARAKYENIVTTALTVPMTSPLYQPPSMAAMVTTAGEVIKELKGQPHQTVNSSVAKAIIQAHLQLQKIAQNLNFLGLSDDYTPVLRFKYLQQTALYLADNATQLEQIFISFRSTAENQTMENIQLHNNVDVNKAALAVEESRLYDTALEMEAADLAKAYADLQAQHAQDAVDEWKVKGKDLATINAELTWAANAGNDQEITYIGIGYNDSLGTYQGTVSGISDVWGRRKEKINYNLQLERLNRQASEAAVEAQIAAVRQTQAQVRDGIQRLAVTVAQKRLDGAVEALDFAENREFGEDLWFKLANELQDLSDQYLDIAIEAAFLMERSYDLEFDRDLKRIRFDYASNGPAGLLGGDYLKRDIALFAQDFLQNAKKSNPVRQVISLSDEYPSEFQNLLDQGFMQFRTDLELFDRRDPGTYRRKIKKVELFVEGMIPLEGVHGTLLHQGISTDWRFVRGTWMKHKRVTPPERMVISSYQQRRDITVFQADEALLGLFENLGVQANWILQLPRSTNNIDYQAISDVKLVLYYDSDYSNSLATFLRTFYPRTGGKSMVLSSRFHYPDEFFRLDADRKVSFLLHPARFAYNVTKLNLQDIAIRLIPKSGPPLASQALTVTRASDGSQVNGSTDAQGRLQSDLATMAPFSAWKNSSPVDTFTIAIGPGTDTKTIADIQLFLDYEFTYRSDEKLLE